MEMIDASRLNLRSTTKEECRSELIEARWQGHFKCPRCAHGKGYWIRSRALFECANRNCRKQTSATAGTQFHKIRDLRSLWVVLKESITNPEIRSSFLRAVTGISLSSARRMIRRFRPERLLSITLMPSDSTANLPERRVQNSLSDISPASPEGSVSALNSSRQFPSLLPALTLSSIRAVSIECYLRRLAAYICPETTFHCAADMKFQPYLKQLASYINPELSPRSFDRVSSGRIS